MGADDAAAVDLDLSAMPNQPNLHRLQKQAAQSFQDVRVLHSGANGAVVLEEVRKYAMRVHGDVSEDVMKNIRLRNISGPIGAARPRGRREHARRQHFKTRSARKESADWSCAPAGPGP